MGRRSWVWWASVLAGLLLVGAYILFNVLDVDGSDLQDRILENPLAQQWSTREAEDNARLGLGIPGTPGRLADLGSPKPSFIPSTIVFSLIPRTREIRQRAILPRGEGAQTLRSSPSPTDDPFQSLC